LGTVDKEYKILATDFLAKIEEAAEIWSQPIGKELFKYDPQAELTINLIYTERQSILDKLDGLEKQLSTGKSSLDQALEEYETLSKNFKSRLEAFNHEVSFWNAQGGAPPDVYERLIKEQEDLKAESVKLNSLAGDLNLSTEKYNLNVEEFNQNVSRFNRVTQEKPEAGLYNSSEEKIDVYLTASDKELIHTLAHELGHDDPAALMYPFNSEVVQPTSAEIESLDAICQKPNWQYYLELVQERLGEKLVSIESN
jgi:hypothetical protein